ncbi:hypothetical protein Tco_0187629 [Tanacetum coccineum]
MLNDPTNQIPGSSSNPGSSTQPAFNQMPYYLNPNYQSQFTNQEELLMFQRIAEDMRVLQIDTRGMDAADAAIINAQKARIRAAYPPPN